MPLILRTVEPKYLSRQVVTGNDHELETVANNTLTNVLRQLASLVLLASEVFEGLAEGLQTVHIRSTSLRAAIERVDAKLEELNPRTVTVPEGDICTFSQRTVHFKARHPIDGQLFTVANRPDTVKRLYDAAAPTPVRTIRSLDQFRRDGNRSSKLFVCTPVLSGRRKRWRKVDLDIETRKPQNVDDLRMWTSTEALGDVTVHPDATVLVDKDEEPADHQLPSPEEQMMVIAMRFPPSVVAVDVSGKAFDRQCSTRRSLTTLQSENEPATRRRRARRRDKRRNTLAGTSHKEIQAAMAGETTTEAEGVEFEPLAPLRAGSGELFKLKGTTSENFKSHLSSLKQWSRGKLRAAILRNHGDLSTSRPSFEASDLVDDDVNVYERIGGVRREGSSTSVDTSIANSIVVKLRENSLQRRNRRAGVLKAKDEPVHSSSGNWSASSESGRTSIASETTAAPKSTSTATSTNSLHHAPTSVQSRRRVLASGSSSVSEGTLTPDINDIDGETSSVYSCDTEGYYTSFHVDSGLKTLKEEDIGLSASALRLDDGPTFPNFQSHNNHLQSRSQSQITAENEYELFGKGSTSTTTSSAGTVCTTLLAGQTLGSSRSLSGFAPAVPERKSSLDRKELSTLLVPDSPSPDSGHNTSSSPGESTGQVESDLEGERVERIRSKTAMTSGRIPSMVAITPPISDEEVGPQAPLRIAIPDVYALPNKPKSNGVLETNIDDDKKTVPGPRHYTVEREVELNKKMGLPVNGMPGQRQYTGEREGENKKMGLPVNGLPGPRQYTEEREVELNKMVNGIAVPRQYTEEREADNKKMGPRSFTSTLDELSKKMGLSMNGGPRMFGNSKKTGPLETNLDDVLGYSAIGAPSPTGESDYVALNAISDSSLERRRQGARVKLDSDGKVVYSSDSLKRKKNHSTFVPGKFVRESPTPSPVLGQRTPKAIRPVQTSGLIKTNADERRSTSPHVVDTRQTVDNRIIDPRRSMSPQVVDSRRSMSPRFVDIDTRRSISPRVIETRRSTSPKLTDRRSVSPKDDRRSPRLGKVFVRSPTRVVSPVSGKKSPSSTLDHPKRNLQNIENLPQLDKKTLMNLRSPSAGFTSIEDAKKRTFNLPLDLQKDVNLRSASPSLSTTSSKRSLDYEEVDGRRWISQHPAAHALQATAAATFVRASAVTRTPPARPSTSEEPSRKSSTPTKQMDKTLDLTLSPIASPKTTMTSEEIFAAIHRSKKRLNIKSADKPKPEVTPTSAKTSLHNFKMLLLQKGGKDTGKMSAAEQLRLSKDVKPIKEDPNAQTPLKMLKQWRFPSPRSNVLSSTIQEDCTEIERPEDALRFRREMESSPLMRRGRSDFEVSKPSRSSPQPNEPFRASPDRLSKPNIESNLDRLSKRSLPEPPPFTNNVGNSSPKRISNNTYAKITAPVQFSPTRKLEKERLNISNSEERKRNVEDARRQFFASSQNVPFESSRQNGSPLARSLISRSVSANGGNLSANGNAYSSLNTSAFKSSTNQSVVRSPNVSLETAL